MSEPGAATQFLREHLPYEVLELLTEEPPERVPDVIADEDLTQYQANMLFQLNLKGRHEALVYLLLEQRDLPDTGISSPLLRNSARIIKRFCDERVLSPLPVLLPFVGHQRTGVWTFFPAFIDLVGFVPTPLSHYLASFRQAMVDLPDQRLKVMGSFEKELVALCRSEDLVRALEQGQASAACALLQLLKRHFGEIALRLRERIVTADSASIRKWFYRARNSYDLDEIFKSGETA